MFRDREVDTRQLKVESREGHCLALCEISARSASVRYLFSFFVFRFAFLAFNFKLLTFDLIGAATGLKTGHYIFHERA